MTPKDKKALKKYFFLSAVIFLASFFGGVFFAGLYPEAAKESLGELQDRFSFLFDLTALQTGAFIFFNNTLKIFLFMVLGVLFALPTVFFLLLNGWVLGFVSAATYPELGVSGLFYSLFFHGIFELAALFLGSSLGIWLGVFAYRQAKKKEKVSFKEPLSFAFGIFLRFIVPLLFIAAVIETFLIFY